MGVVVAVAGVAGAVVIAAGVVAAAGVVVVQYITVMFFMEWAHEDDQFQEKQITPQTWPTRCLFPLKH